MKPRGAYLSSCLTYCTWRDTLSVPSCWDKGQVVDSEEPSCCSHGGGSGGRFPRRRQRAPPSPWSPRDGPLTGGRRLAAVTRGSLRVGGGRLPRACCPVRLPGGARASPLPTSDAARRCCARVSSGLGRTFPPARRSRSSAGPRPRRRSRLLWPVCFFFPFTRGDISAKNITKSGVRVDCLQLPFPVPGLPLRT